MAELQEFYGEENREQLYASTLHEAIVDYIDGLEWDSTVDFRTWFEAEVAAGEERSTVMFCRFKQMQPTLSVDWLLELALEHMDMDFGPEDNPGLDEPTERMREAAEQFCRVMAEDYPPCMCEVVEKIPVDLLAYLNANLDMYPKGEDRNGGIIP